MARIRILFADDQIPDEALADETIHATLKQKNPDWSDGFIAAFPIMRKAVTTLRESGYEVDVAKSRKEAMSKAKSVAYDLAIIDLGWYADETLPRDQQAYAGWDISQAIEEADRRSGKKPTPQIIYSNRFEKDPAISMQAADQRKLPLFKIYSDAGHQALRAAVKFIESYLSMPSSTERFLDHLRQSLLECLVEPLKQHSKWFKLTVAFVGLSFALLLAGLSTAIWGNVEVGVIASASSIITGAISTLLLAQLRSSQRVLALNRSKLESIVSDYEKHAKKLA